MVNVYRVRTCKHPPPIAWIQSACGSRLEPKTRAILVMVKIGFTYGPLVRGKKQSNTCRVQNASAWEVILCSAIFGSSSLCFKICTNTLRCTTIRDHWQICRGYNFITVTIAATFTWFCSKRARNYSWFECTQAPGNKWYWKDNSRVGPRFCASEKLRSFELCPSKAWTFKTRRTIYSMGTSSQVESLQCLLLRITFFSVCTYHQHAQHLFIRRLVSNLEWHAQ